MLRTFFDRIIEWDWPDAPAAHPDLRHRPARRRRPAAHASSTTRDAARLLRAAAADPDPLRRLVRRSCWPAPGSASVSSARSQADAVRAPWTTSRGYGSRSASSTTTATSPCTPSSLDLLDDWPASHDDAGDRAAPDQRRTTRSTVTPSAASSNRVAPRRRARPRPPAPAAAHPRDPSDQPRHAPRSDRRACSATGPCG